MPNEPKKGLGLDDFSALRGDETAQAFQDIIAPLVEDSLAVLASQGVDVSDYALILSYLEGRGVKVTAEVENLVRRQLEEASHKSHEDALHLGSVLAEEGLDEMALDEKGANKARKPFRELVKDTPEGEGREVDL